MTQHKKVEEAFAHLLSQHERLIVSMNAMPSLTVAQKGILYNLMQARDLVEMCLHHSRQIPTPSKADLLKHRQIQAQTENEFDEWYDAEGRN